jgi:exopolysaccharide production protein ExoQ
MTVLTPLQPSAVSRPHTLSLLHLAMFWGALQIILGLTFRTFETGVAPPSMEFFRQTGIVVFLAEAFVIVFAIMNGMTITPYWRKLDLISKLMATLFLSSIWVGAAYYSASPVFSLTLNFVLCGQILFGLAVHHCLGSVNDTEIRQMRAVFVGIMVAFTLMIGQYFFQVWDENQTGVWQFAIPGFISVRLFGAVCGAIVALVLTSILVEHETRRLSVHHFAALTFLLALTIWTGTRAAVIGVAGAFVINWLFFSLRPRLPLLMKLGVCTVVAFALATVLLPPDPVFQMFQSGDYVSAESASAGRLEYWRMTWNTFLTAPVFGIGYGGTFWTTPAGLWPHVQPHNVVLQYLVNWGLLGAIPAFYLLGRLVWRAQRIAAQQRFLLPVLAMLNCLLLMSLLDGVLHFARETMMVVICLAIILRAGDQSANA